MSVTIAGDEALCTPIEGAQERLIQLAQALLTAAYRLDVIEVAEESVAGEEKASVSYSPDFGSDLLPLGDAARLLGWVDPKAVDKVAAPADA